LRTKGALIVLLGGIIGGGFGTSGIFVGSAYAGAAVTPCIVALSPLFSIVGAHILFGEKITCRVLLAACVIIVGAILVYSVQMPSLKSLDSSAVLGIVDATTGTLGWGWKVQYPRMFSMYWTQLLPPSSAISLTRHLDSQSSFLP
jgi:drug/metabolite transporter (DMT)-like permease